MKFQLKAIVAAVALSASFPVLAQMELSNGGTVEGVPFGGNGSFMLTIYDSTANVQASFDLGKNYLDFNGLAAAGTVVNPSAFSLNLASDANYSSAWTSFVGAATTPNIRWTIQAADNYAGYDAVNEFDLDPSSGNIGYISTYSSIGTLHSNQVMQNNIGLFEGFMQLENFQGHTAANGSKYTANATQATQFYLNGTFGGSVLGPQALGLLNTTMNLAQYTYAGDAGGSGFAVQRNLLEGTYSLTSAGLLTYSAAVAPVPEADTWAMMLLGLGFMGFVARRKQA